MAQKTIKRLRDGDIILFSRGQSRAIQCRVRDPRNDEWKQQSTKKTDVDAAAAFAEKWHDELKFKDRYGIIGDPKSFAHVWGIYLKEMERLVGKKEMQERRRKEKQAAGERYLVPYFGQMLMDGITDETITAYRRWRSEYWTTGPGKEGKVTYERNGKTVTAKVAKTSDKEFSGLENAILSEMFELAVTDKFMLRNQIPNLKRKRAKKRSQSLTSARAAFNAEEFKTLIAALKEYRDEEKTAQGKKIKNRPARELLYDYVCLLVDTGLRPGTETDSLVWDNIQPFWRDKKLFNKDGTMNEGAKLDIALKVFGKKQHWRDAIGRQITVKALHHIRYRRQMFTHEQRDKEGKVVKAGWSGWGSAPKIDGKERVLSLPDGTPISTNHLSSMFSDVLTKIGMLESSEGEARSMYSLRHTHATFQLLQGTRMEDLSETMDTSIAMLEKHYSHLKPKLVSGKLATLDIGI